MFYVIRLTFYVLTSFFKFNISFKSHSFSCTSRQLCSWERGFIFLRFTIYA